MAQQNLTSNDTQASWLVEVINVKWVHYMMHKPNHTPCTMKQIVEPPITCLSINIWSNDRSNVPQNDPTPHGHVSQRFLAIINVVPHVHTHLAHVSWKGVVFLNDVFWPFKDPNISFNVNPTLNSPFYK
jgi:hypothetical protein